MAPTCNPSTLGGWGGWITRSRNRDHPGQHGETPSLLKIQKITWAWWHVPVIPATQEAEAGNCLNPGGGGCRELYQCCRELYQCCRSYHCTPAWWQSVSNKKERKKRRKEEKREGEERKDLTISCKPSDDTAEGDSLAGHAYFRVECSTEHRVPYLGMCPKCQPKYRSESLWNLSLLLYRKHRRLKKMM